jgi:hypothetical protein
LPMFRLRQSQSVTLTCNAPMLSRPNLFSGD